MTEADLTTLVGFYEAGRETGGFDAGIQRALTRILVDPEFLFRLETDPPDVAPATPYRLGDLELASRLSFFLWSSLPDDVVARSRGPRITRSSTNAWRGTMEYRAFTGAGFAV